MGPLSCFSVGLYGSDGKPVVIEVEADGKKEKTIFAFHGNCELRKRRTS